MRKLIFFLLTLSLVYAVQYDGPAQAQEDFVVIVHPGNPTTSMSKKELAKVFLKKTRRWDDGVDAEPVDLPAQSDVRKAFSKDVHGRSAAGIQSYWQRQIFSGNGVPPLELADDAEVTAFVKGNRGGVGYVSAATPVDGVKVLKLTE